MSVTYPETEHIHRLLVKAKTVVIAQADNPDGDSLASSLALEQILGDMGKEVSLYCGVDIPTYLRYLPGWDRVSKELPKQFDLSIIVDTSADSLFETLEKSGQRSWLASKPCIIIDHHAVEADIPFATVVCNHPAVATSEVIYELAKQLEWPLNQEACDMVAVAIMSDSLGLMSEGTTARSIQIVSELVEQGVSLAKLDNARRAMMRKSPDLLHYKGQLLQRIEYYDDSRIVTLTIPWEEIEQYSPIYNPPMLVMDDMRMSEGAAVAIAFKVYRDGKVTGKIRANYGFGIAGDIAKAFGGGGHTYASGFKVTDGRPFSEIKSECIQITTSLLNKLQEQSDEAA